MIISASFLSDPVVQPRKGPKPNATSDLRPDRAGAHPYRLL